MTSPGAYGGPSASTASGGNGLAAEVHTLERALFEVKRIIVGQDQLLERILVGPAGQGTRAARRGARGWPRPRGARPSPRCSAAPSPASSSPPTWCPPTSSAPGSTDQGREEFAFEPGPSSRNFVLADEINRAPPKTQSALLEAMQERTVTIGSTTYPLPELRSW